MRLVVKIPIKFKKVFVVKDSDIPDMDKCNAGSQLPDNGRYTILWICSKGAAAQRQHMRRVLRESDDPAEIFNI